MVKSHQPRHGTLRDKTSLKDQALIVGAPLDVAGNAFALGVCGATRCFFSLTMDVRLIMERAYPKNGYPEQNQMS